MIDDSSTDSTVNVASRILRESKVNYRIVHHDRNLGLSASLNDGLSDLKGDFVLVLHQDCELIGSDWISNAIRAMGPGVGVVTGYYGIPDMSEMNASKKAFGVLRRQLHPRPKVESEPVNFSEGKCDLYRMQLLRDAGGFPQEYRIAGEDLSLSLKLRSRGYSIVKNYSLAVVQRFTGKAETFWGNLRKELEFGRAIGGVLAQHRGGVFDGIEAGYGRARTLHRGTQVLFSTVFLSMLVLAFLFQTFPLIALCLALAMGRYGYYVISAYRPLRMLRALSSHPVFDALWIAILGIPSDIAYSLGFFWGLLVWGMRGRV